MMAAMKTYHAEVTRDGKWWSIHVPEIDRTTQARNRGEIELMARDLIAIMEDVPPSSFALDVAINPEPAGPAAPGSPAVR